MKIQESKPENQDKVRSVPSKMKGTEQSVNRHLLKEKRIQQATRPKPPTQPSNGNGIDFHVLIVEILQQIKSAFGIYRFFSWAFDLNLILNIIISYFLYTHPPFLFVLV